MRILQACERLEIPGKLWPKFTFPDVRQFAHHRSYIPRHKIQELDFPPFNALEETIAEWKLRCHKILDGLLAEYAEKFEAIFQDALKQGLYTKIPQHAILRRPISAMSGWHREFATRIPYRKLAKDGYTAERVKQSVLQILRTAEWNKGE
jgi:hypothetical protein